MWRALNETVVQDMIVAGKSVSRDSTTNRPSHIRRLFDIHVDPPKSPDLSVLHLFHRNEGSYVSFLRREHPEDAGLKPFRYVRVEDLTTRAPSPSALSLDSYFSINGFRQFRTRRTEDLSALNAAVVDLDYHRTGIALRWQEVVDVIESAVVDEIIPAPSLIVNSGRGAWLGWLLIAEDDSARAPTAPTSNRLYLRKINDGIVAMIRGRFPQLGGDPSSAELTRCLRVNGSVNSKSGNFVRFFVHRTPWESPLTYTLDQLAADLDVRPPSFRREQRSFLRAALPKMGSRQKRGGSTNLSRVLNGRLHEIEKIEQARGGFREGHRNYAALVIAVTLRTLHRSLGEIAAYVSDFAQRCRPPLLDSEVRGATAERRYRFKNATIANRLGISLEEADSLDLRVIRPDYLPRRPEANVTKGRRQAAQTRREELRAIVRDLDEKGHHDLPPLGALVTQLMDRGIRTTRRTVSKDLDILEIARDHRRGRPRIRARQLTLDNG